MWLEESFVYLRNISSRDTEVHLIRRRKQPVIVICNLMMINRRRYRYLFFIVGTIAVLTLLDFSPMFYQRLFGNGGTFVKQYSFNISGDSLIKQLLTCNNKLDFKVTPSDKSGYSYIQVFSHEYKEYIHMWVRTNQAFSAGTEIVFYGISNSPDFKDSKIIKRDYDFIFCKLTTDKFERLIIDKLNEKGSI
jgi:hypothetical protein